jgi:very-short-patch-repair endonuclease
MSKSPPQNKDLYLKYRAREMRRKPTWGEETMWDILRSRRLTNLKFRRQHKVGPYIVDFYCAEKKLAIEIDGLIHEKAGYRDYDAVRTTDLRERGLRILRFTNTQVCFELKFVLSEIIYAATLTPTPSI